MGIMAHIESVLGRPHIYNNPEYIQGFTIYTPVKPFRDEHGVVVAQVINVQREGEVIKDNYYSRAWAYWNFIDNTLFDLKEADELLQLETQMMPNKTIDYKISESETVLMWLDHGLIPIESEFWQRLVVSLAYNTITDPEFLYDLAENTWYGPEAVQNMLDKAAGEVMKHPNFSLTGFEQLIPQ